jgi:ornithine cyclodeaminase/alanine dehydrogenase
VTLFIDADLVEELADMTAVIDEIEAALLAEARGEVSMPARLNIELDGRGFFRIMPAVLHSSGLMGFKEFHRTSTGSVRYLIALLDLATGEFLALVDGNRLTAIRTGATTGIATRYLAPEQIHSVGVIGSGVEARTNLEAMCAVRNIDDVRVYSPRPDRRSEFADWASGRLGVSAAAIDEPQTCVEAADMVLVATNTSPQSDPIAFRGDWVAPGQHINSIGSTTPDLRELDPGVFARADVVCVDSPEQVLTESGDVLAAMEEGTYHPERVLSLASLVTSAAPVPYERTSRVSLFKSVGTAVQDIAAAKVVYDAARRQGSGRDLGDLFEVKSVR